MSGKHFTYFYSFNVSSLQPSKVDTICLSLASKESKAWSPPYSGCNLKEAGVWEKGNEARKGGDSIWRCVIKLVATKYDRFLLLILPWDHSAKSCVTCISDSHIGGEGRTVCPPVPICPLRLFICTLFWVGTCHTPVSAGKSQGGWREAGMTAWG